PYYRGRVNLTSAQFTRLECKANVENEDFTQKFLNRDTVPVDLFGNTGLSGGLLPAATRTTVALHSRSIVRRFDGNVRGPQSLDLSPGQVFDEQSRSQTLYFGYTEVTNEIGLQQISGGFVSGNSFDAVPIYNVPDTGLYEIELAANVNINVRETDVGEYNEVDIKFHYRINGSPDTATVLAVDSWRRSSGLDYNRRFTIAPRTYAEQLVPGDRIYLYAEVYVHEIDGTLIGGNYNFDVVASELPGTYLRIRAVTRTTPTPCVGLLAYEGFERLAQALTDEPDAFRSNFFGRSDTRRPYPVDGPGALHMVTSGFQVRGFPLLTGPTPATGTDARKSLYANWREHYDSEAAVWGLGYGIELSETGRPVIRVEDLGYFYPREVVLDLSLDTPTRPAPSAEVTTKVLADRHYQALEFGYPTWQAEQVNGLEEANSKRQWATPLTQVKTMYSQLSKYITSGQLLEVTRRMGYVDSDTTDNRSDNNNFLICLRRKASGGYETERNQSFTLLSGVLDPSTIYNARLSPARNLRRHGAVIRAGLTGVDDGAVVRFVFGEGNNGLRSRLPGETSDVVEGAPIPVEELAPPLWRAESDSITGLPVTRAQVRQLLANPLGRIRY
ncbi:MAG TPA: hypothetical protein VF690_05960, partial [Hymenobacter sp.]